MSKTPNVFAAPLSPTEWLSHSSQYQRDYILTHAADQLRLRGKTTLTLANGLPLLAVLDTFKTDTREDVQTSRALNLLHVATRQECAAMLRARLKLNEPANH